MAYPTTHQQSRTTTARRADPRDPLCARGCSNQTWGWHRCENSPKGWTLTSPYLNREYLDKAGY